MNPAYQNVRFHADLPKAGVPSRFANEASLLRLVTALIAQPEVSAALLSGSGSTMLAILNPGFDTASLVARTLERYGENCWTFLGQTT